MAASDIQTNSLEPKRVTVDGNSVEQVPVGEQIAAERFKKAEAAKTSKKAGLKTFRLRSQGTA